MGRNNVFKSYFRTKHLFKYRTLVTWKKLTTNNKVFYGMGSYFRNATEHIMIFTQQGAKPLRFSLRNIFEEQAGKRTIKPKQMEAKILEFLQPSKGVYIFSGTNIESFCNFDIDCVDIQYFYDISL